MSGTGCTLGVISSVCLPLSFSLLGHSAARWSHQPSQSDGAGVMVQLSCLGRGSRASETPHLRTYIRQICTLLSSMLRLHQQFGSADELLVGSTTWALWVRTWSAKIGVLAVGKVLLLSLS